MDRSEKNQSKPLRRWKRKAITTVLSVCVAVGTTAALVLPAVTLSDPAAESRCNYEALGVHVHTADCLDEAGAYICGLSDRLVHSHDDLCYDESGALLCALPEVEAHTHAEICYTAVETVLDPGHTHTEACYDAETGAPLCGEEERPAVTEPGEPELTCEKEELILHTHTEDCYETPEATEGEEPPQPVLICTLPVVEQHQHTEECLAPPEEPEETTAPEETDWAALVPETLSPEWDRALTEVAASQLGYTESLADRAEDAEGVSHGATLYGEAGADPYGPWDTDFVIWCLNRAGIGEEALPRNPDVADWQTLLKDHFLLLTGEPAVGDVVFLDLDGDENADTVGILAAPAEDQPLYTWDGSQPETAPTLCTLQGDFDDGVAQVAWEAGKLTGYASTAGAQERHVAQDPENAEEKDRSRTLRLSDATVTASWGEDAGFSADVTLAVRELEPDSEEYQFYTDQLFDCWNLGEIFYLRLLDIAFQDGDGQEVEPNGYVDIEVRYDEAILSVGTDYDVVHFTDDGDLELLTVEPVEEEGALMGFRFSQDSFSASALIITEHPERNSGSTTFALPDAQAESGSAAKIVMSGGATAGQRISDAVTVDHWQKYFSTDPTAFTTEFVGGVVNDKSVTTGTITYTDTDGATGTIQADDGSFLVGLSSMGSTQTVSGLTSAPTDVIFILDMSSSMYGGHDVQNNANIKAMLKALDEAIARLNELNPYNRIGVVLYRGYCSIKPQSDNTHSTVFLPLDRYTSTSGSYIVINPSSGKITGLKMGSGVKNSAGTPITKEYAFVQEGIYTAGTYSQAGILNAMDEFLSAATVVNTASGTIPRRPVFVFMSDGEPTAATEEYTVANEKKNGGKRYATMGNNQVVSRHAAESDFVTQLSAAYAKEMVKQHYNECEEDPLYYTLGFKMDGLSLDIMDPSGVKANPTIGLPRYKKGETETVNLTEKISGFWETLINNGSVTFDTENYSNTSSSNTTDPTTKATHKVTTTTLTDNTVFPSSMDQQEYVDKYFSADSADDLQDAFDDIILEISLHETFVVTESTVDHSTSGYITFVDTLGEYMTVTDMEGLILEGHLYNGTELAKNFLAHGADGAPDPENKLGSGESWTDLGTAFLFSVMDQLGLSRDTPAQVQTGRNLIDAAYNTGQLYWNGNDDYSHYIEWWASENAETGAHTFLGFYHEAGVNCGHNCTEEKHYSDAPPGATYRIRSYFYVGQTSGEEVGSMTDSNVLYTTVWVRTELATGQESVVFRLPNALLPTVDYDIGLDQDKQPIRLEAIGASCPAMLCYQVGLRADVDVEKILKENTYAGIRRDNSGTAQSVYFYSNDYNTQSPYDLTNTFAYFEPGSDNSRYYYTGPVNEVQGSPTLMYTKTCSEDDCTNDGHYQKVMQIGDPEQIAYYERHIYYSRAGDKLQSHVTYIRVSASVFDKHGGSDYSHLEQSNGYWYIKSGIPHSLSQDALLSSEYTAKKTPENGHTQTAAHYDLPYTNPGDNSPGSRYIVGAMLGNNGRLEVKPVALSGTKTMAGVNLAAYEFDFELYEADKDFSTVKLLQTVQNTGSAHNEIRFSALWPALPGEYRYVVQEKVDDSNEHVIFDETQYQVTVTVDANYQTSVKVVKAGTDNNLGEAGLSFTNKMGTKLPNTGGAGTLPYMIGGWSLMAAAGAMILKPKRSKRKGAS